MEVFCLKLLVFLLCTCISVVLRVGWGWFPATLLLLLCRKCVEKTRVPFFVFLLPPSPLLKNVFVIILLVVRVAVPTTTAVVVAVS